tara:strand:- start:1382 stop:2890 length:1509 start_codon:yes stop_codon:yes gene_type:complete
MKLLGLRLCEHDSNISYFDGQKVHYLKSERLHQIKHHGYDNLWEYKNDIKRVFNIDVDEVDEIAIVIDPWVHKLPTDNEEFYPAIDYNYLPSKCKVTRVNHHLAHALSCWPLQSNRPEYEIIIDGFGDINNAWTVIKNDKVIKRGYMQFNGSLGAEMCQAGKWLNIEHNKWTEYDVAGKLMGLQSYGNILSKFKETLDYDMSSINKLFDRENYFKFMNSQLLGTLKPLDWIRTVHDKVSDILVKFFEDITDKNYNATISYSGGVAQNVIWNTALKNKFKNLVIPPHCNDEGLSLGALEYLRVKNNLPKFKLDNFPYCQSDESVDEASDDTINKTVQHLKEGKIVGWYQGYGEIGPRALGHRSLLINPMIENAKDIINKVKNRESYRPFGASILKEHQKEYFGTDIHNPHMLYVGSTTKINLDSITHIDGTCRYQTVDESNGVYYKLLRQFYRDTGCPLLLNTSFNINGKPILGNTQDTKLFFKESKIDVLVLGNDINISGQK